MRGYSIHQQQIPKPLQFSNSEIIMANECIETFLEKKIIEVSNNESSASSFVVIGLSRALWPVKCEPKSKRNETKRNIKWSKTYFNQTISWGKTRQKLNEQNRENII